MDNILKCKPDKETLKLLMETHGINLLVDTKDVEIIAEILLAAEHFIHNVNVGINILVFDREEIRNKNLFISLSKQLDIINSIKFIDDKNKELLLAALLGSDYWISNEYENSLIDTNPVGRIIEKFKLKHVVISRVEHCEILGNKDIKIVADNNMLAALFKIGYNMKYYDL